MTNSEELTGRTNLSNLSADTNDWDDSWDEWMLVPRTPFTDLGSLVISSLAALAAGIFLGWVILG